MSSWQPWGIEGDRGVNAVIDDDNISCHRNVDNDIPVVSNVTVGLIVSKCYSGVFE